MFSADVIRKYDFANIGPGQVDVTSSVWRDQLIPSLGGRPSEEFIIEEVTPIISSGIPYLTMYVGRHRSVRYDLAVPLVLLGTSDRLLSIMLHKIPYAALSTEYSSFAFAPTILSFSKDYKAIVVVLRRLQGHVLRCSQDDFATAM